MDFKQQQQQKRQKYLIKIRRQIREKEIIQNRRKLVLKVFGFDPFSQDIVSIQRLTELLSEYLDSQNGNIQNLLDQFASALQSSQYSNKIDKFTTPALLKRLYFDVERQDQHKCRQLRNKILSLMTVMQVHSNIFTPKSVIDLDIIDFFTMILKNNTNSLQVSLFFLNELHYIRDVIPLLYSSKELKEQIQRVTIMVLQKTDHKTGDNLVKLFLEFWSSVDFSDFNIQDKESIIAIYNLASLTIANSFHYIYSMDNQINQINIVNALKIIHEFFDIYTIDMITLGRLNFYPEDYCCLLDNQNVVEGRYYILRIMAFIVTKSEKSDIYCKQIVNNTNYLSKIGNRINNVNIEIIIITLHNIIYSLGCHFKLLPAIEALVYELSFDEFMKQQDRQGIIDILLQWFVFNEKQGISKAELKIFDIMKDMKEMVDEDKEILLWKKARQLGHRNDCPAYLNDIDLD